MSTHYRTSQELPLYDLVHGLAWWKRKSIAQAKLIALARTSHDIRDIHNIMLVELVPIAQRGEKILVLQERSMMKEQEEMNGQDVSGEEWNDDNYLHIHMNDEKTEVTGFTRYGMNNVENMVRVIEFQTGVKLISEHDENYHEKEDV